MEQTETAQRLPDSTVAIASANQNLSCTSCQKPLDGDFARALDGAFHWECFLCIVRRGERKTISFS
jgi:hypothetical protein